MINKILKTKNKPSGENLKQKIQPNNRSDYSFRLIIAIIEHGSAEDITELLSNKFDIKFYIVCQGDGTADSAILQLLNLDKSSKDVVICVVETAKCSEVLQGINDGYEGSGIAFSIKLNSIGGMRTLKLFKGDFNDSNDKNKGNIKEWGDNG